MQEFTPLNSKGGGMIVVDTFMVYGQLDQNLMLGQLVWIPRSKFFRSMYLLHDAIRLVRDETLTQEHGNPGQILYRVSDSELIHMSTRNFSSAPCKYNYIHIRQVVSQFLH